MSTRDRREYMKKYHAENSEKIKEQKAKYYSENSEKIKEQKAKYYSENSEKIKEIGAKYRAENSEKIKERKAKYRAENSEKIKKLIRTPKSRWKALKNGAKRRGLPVEITYEQWLALVETSECYYCEGTLPETGGGIDRVDSTKGYVEGNCVPCCTICNKILLDHNNEDVFKHMVKMINVRAKRILAKNANK